MDHITKLRVEIARLTRALTLGASDYVWHKRHALQSELESHTGRPVSIIPSAKNRT